MTTNPHVKAGGLPPTDLHRVEPSMLPNATESDEPDEDGGPEMLAHVLVLVLACLVLGSFIAGWL